MHSAPLPVHCFQCSGYMALGGFLCALFGASGSPPGITARRMRTSIAGERHACTDTDSGQRLGHFTTGTTTAGLHRARAPSVRFLDWPMGRCVARSTRAARSPGTCAGTPAVNRCAIHRPTQAQCGTPCSASAPVRLLAHRTARLAVRSPEYARGAFSGYLPLSAGPDPRHLGPCGDLFPLTLAPLQYAGHTKGKSRFRGFSLKQQGGSTPTPPCAPVVRPPQPACDGTAQSGWTDPSAAFPCLRQHRSASSARRPSATPP